MESVYLLTGRPGVGKTTVIRKTLFLLPIKAGGFYTEEIRKNGLRKGFKLVTLDHRETILSHVDSQGHNRVGKYTVNVQNLDSVGVEAVQEAIKDSDLIVIDEIGKMELFSPAFKSSVLQAVSSGKKMLGTIMSKSDSFADRIKQLPNVKIIETTPANRDKLPEELAGLLK
jgi:nucleoside-triphosphatase